MSRKPRMGVLIKDSGLADWKRMILRKAFLQDLVELVAFIIVPEEEQQKERLWQKHMRWDNRYFNPKPQAFKHIHLEDSFSSVLSIKRQQQERIKTASLDILINFTDTDIPSDIYDYLSLGSLSFTHGEGNNCSEDFLGYWEFIRFQEVITSALTFQTEADQQARVLYRTWSMMPTLSISRARNEHAWKLTSLAFRAIKEISASEPMAFLDKVKAGQKISSGSKDIHQKEPATIEALICLSKHFYRLAFKVFRKLAYKEQWIILLNMQQSRSISFTDFKKILPPKDRFWADPFLIEQDNKRYLFIEELPFATDKGHLSVMEIDEDGKVSTAVTILEKPYHLSYPFIFQLDGKYFMIPESYEDKSIQLYECTTFPFQWEHKMNLMSKISAFDTTLFFYDETWWMFTVISEQRGSGHNDELFLFFADTPFTTDWESHPQNPVLSDVRQARPAGNIYQQDGKLIRPSQDCARKYGFGFNLNEIEVLSKTEYREKRILNVRPDWDHQLSRTHSFNHVPGCTVIDAVIQRSRFF